MSKPKTPSRPTVHRARIPADAMTVLVVQVVALLGVWVCAIVVSFTGLVAAAGWANIAGQQRYAVPLFIDGILVGASLAYLVARERRDRASAVIAVLAMGVFCGLSILGNASHALGAAVVGSERLTGVALAVAAPVAILVTTELLARTVIASPDEHVPAVSSRAARRATVRSGQVAPVTAGGGAATLPVPAGPVPAPVAPAVRTTAGAGAGVPRAVKIAAVRDLDQARPGLSERAAEAALCEAHGPGWISRTTVARIRKELAGEGAAVPVLAAVR